MCVGSKKCGTILILVENSLDVIAWVNLRYEQIVLSDNYLLYKSVNAGGYPNLSYFKFIIYKQNTIGVHIENK